MDFTKIEHYENEYLDTHHDSALAVTTGVEDQPTVNPYFVRKRKRKLTTDEYVEGILNRNTVHRRRRLSSDVCPMPATLSV